MSSNGKKHATKAETQVIDGVLKYLVEPHFRAFPGEAKPHWSAVRVLGGQVTAIWTSRGWAPTFTRWPKFLRNELKKLHKDEMENEIVHLVRVD